MSNKVKMTEVRKAWVTAANKVLGPVTTMTRKYIQNVT